LMMRPEVLLVDNPLAGLDLSHRAWWFSLLGQLSRGHEWMNGKPVKLIITTNDLRAWRGCARQFAVLKDKSFVVIVSLEQAESASDELVRELMAANQEE